MFDKTVHFTCKLVPQKYTSDIFQVIFPQLQQKVMFQFAENEIPAFVSVCIFIDSFSEYYNITGFVRNVSLVLSQFSESLDKR